MIKVGDKIPAVNVTVAGPGDHKAVSAAELFAGKKVVLFAVPGAFTPTCSEAHLPGFVVNADAVKAKGVDMIACISVNDAFVMEAWGKAQNASEITMLADGGGAFTKAIDAVFETADFGGLRSVRYSMLIDDGTVSAVNAEDGGGFEVSSAETILQQL